MVEDEDDVAAFSDFVADAAAAPATEAPTPEPVAAAPTPVATTTAVVDPPSPAPVATPVVSAAESALDIALLERARVALAQKYPTGLAQ